MKTSKNDDPSVYPPKLIKHVRVRIKKQHLDEYDFSKSYTKAKNKRPLPFIKLQNTSLHLLFLRLESSSNIIMNHDLRTKSTVFSNTLGY